MKKFFAMGLTILSLSSISFTAHAEQLQLASFRNTVAGINYNEDSNVKKSGWVQELNSDGKLGWKYYDVDGKPHFGGLQLDNKYFYFDINSGWLVN